mmetsp:Transcript_26410/g.48313  ORF Transcript_26410/g.48313 Transcript_26410/m.48313 type:complete len:194 (+) Transcript_26410:99-680(+)
MLAKLAAFFFTAITLAFGESDSCSPNVASMEATGHALLQHLSQPQPAQLVAVSKQQVGPCQYVRGMTNVSCPTQDPFQSAPCGMANQLFIASGQRTFDEPDRDNAIQSCGPICNDSPECSGFQWMDGKCYFRRTVDLVPPCENGYLSFWEGGTCFRKVDCVAPFTSPVPLPNCSEQAVVETALLKKPVDAERP